MFHITFDEKRLAEVVENAVKNALKDKTKEQQPEHRILHSIRELAEFLNCSTVTAQKYKNEGWIPYMQIGRKVMFDAFEVLKTLEKGKNNSVMSIIKTKKSKPIIIPIEMCQDALKNKYVRVLQVYIWLKVNCSGKIEITASVFRNMAKDFDLKSEKTLKPYIHYLLEKGWITKSKKSGIIFIKSFEIIRELEKFARRTGAEFNFKDIKNFKGFLVAAVISQLISVQKKKEWLLVTERIKRGSKTVASTPHLYYPVANKAIAKIFGVSISTAFKWKKLAKKHGYIKIRRKYGKLDFLDASNINEFKKYGDAAERICFRKEKYYEKLPDRVYSKNCPEKQEEIGEIIMEKIELYIKGNYKGNGYEREKQRTQETKEAKTQISHFVK